MAFLLINGVISNSEYINNYIIITHSENKKIKLYSNLRSILSDN